MSTCLARGGGVSSSTAGGEGVPLGVFELFNSSFVMGRSIYEGIHPSLPSISTYQVSTRKMNSTIFYFVC